MLGVEANKFSVGKEIYYPFAVEMHYFRVEKRHWSICFERIRRAGFRIISTSVPWNLHQEQSNDIDFTGFANSRKDLVVFLELAREFGFKVILRPGPWIAGQWPNGGLPDFLFRDIKIYARDAKGQELKLPADAGVKEGFLPSYLHPHYYHYLKNYFQNFIETTKNYIHPRGPIFMIEIDFETSFGRYLNPASADYNPDILAQYLPRFLSERYEDIKKLNQVYKMKFASFEEVEPPREFKELDLRDFPRVFDWFRFREFILKQYLSVLEDLFKSYTVEPLFFRSLYSQPGDLLPAFNLNDSSFNDEEEGNRILLGTNVFPEGTYFDLIQKGRMLRGEYGFAWASSFISGSAVEEPAAPTSAEYSDGLRRFYIVAGMIAGFNGFNHYMFVNRDHWTGAPMANDGTITSGYEVIRNFNAAIIEMKANELERHCQICVLGDRYYEWIRLLEDPKQFGYMDSLIKESIGGICRDLMNLKLDYDICETLDVDKLKNYKLVIIPSAEFMPEEKQESIIELLKTGTNVLLSGLMPKYNNELKDCQVLSRHLRIKTTLGSNIEIIESKSSSFTAKIYGHILSTDSKIKKLATVGKKSVGVSSSKYRGQLYMFTFNLGSNYDHNKMLFIEQLLSENEIAPAMYCSDPSIDLTIQTQGKKAYLFIVAPPPGELPSIANIVKRDVIIRADIRKFGIASAKLKLTNLLEGEEAESMTITADSLRRGIQIKIDSPDGLIYRIEKK